MDLELHQNKESKYLRQKTRKKDGNIQFEITKEYLLDFIKKNEELSDMLYKYRGY